MSTSRAEALDDALREREAKVAEENAIITDLRSQVASLTVERDKLGREVRNHEVLKALAAKLEEENTQLKAEAGMVMSQTKGLDLSVSVAGSDANPVVARVEGMRALLEQVTAEKTAALERERVAEQEVRILNDTIHELEGERDSMKQQRDAALREKDEAVEAHKAAVAEKSQLEINTKALREGSERAILLLASVRSDVALANDLTRKVVKVLGKKTDRADRMLEVIDDILTEVVSKLPPEQAGS